mmetsp:Transcript_19988/g.14700  ORF Transcript_19988/g.14700 Transcript_19988/m.14700 type:complete len:270 (+) Transcript_19988:519-1328(+)|eukprot:CAMPEP_0202965390 /NCGR_PEP_ID=MMETSP1396-20130829/9378_1 /ASSEMBLY_ACC=CAM_ASM_000872 /TAXON_ID= /ORGANISM="Pseudokeronopsis sp., Strain Brazil" /LENGTH=269 /DNA_ID=CAMNT_0049688081 /DNA_START=503 /DNA_END=1312 /DNA_ORIENTATION=-
MEPEFILISLKFFKYVAKQPDSDVFTTLYSLANEHFDKLSARDLAELTLNLALLEEASERALKQKVQFLQKVEAFLLKNELMIKDLFRQRDLELVIVGLANARVGNNDIWRVLERGMLSMIESSKPTEGEPKELLLCLVHFISRMQVQNSSIWVWLMRRVTLQMKAHALSCRDLSYIVYALFVVKLQAPKMIDIIVKYFNDMGFNEKDLVTEGDRISINFIHQISYLNGGLADRKFFGVVSAFARARLEHLNRFKVVKLLDVFKYMQHF